MTRVGELSVLEVFKFKVFIIFGKALVYCILPILYVIYLIKLDADLFTLHQAVLELLQWARRPTSLEKAMPGHAPL